MEKSVERTPVSLPVIVERTPVSLPVIVVASRERERDPQPIVEIAPLTPTTLRCPYCHTTVVPKQERLATCERCSAIHHAACWSESLTCASCRHTGSRESAQRRRRLRRLAFVLPLVGVMGGLGAITSWSRPQPSALQSAPVPPPADTSSERRSPRGDSTNAIAPAKPTTDDPTADGRIAAARELAGTHDRNTVFECTEPALAAVERDHRGQVLKDLRKAHRRADNDAVGWCRIGEVETASGDLDVARKSLDYAIALDPCLSRAYAARARVLLRTGSIDEAESDLERAFAHSPVSALVFEVRAELRLKKGEYAGGALFDLTTALERDPESRDAHRLRAVAWARLENFDDALAELKELRAQSSWSFDVRLDTFIGVLSGEHAAPLETLDTFNEFARRCLPRQLTHVWPKPAFAHAYVVACLRHGIKVEAESPRHAIAAYTRVVELAVDADTKSDATRRRSVLLEQVSRAEWQELELQRGLALERRGDLATAEESLFELRHAPGQLGVAALRALSIVCERRGSRALAYSYLRDAITRGGVASPDDEARLEALEPAFVRAEIRRAQGRASR